MKTVSDLDVKGRKILVRTDFDVPISPEGTIGEEFRILRQKPLIEQLVTQGARVVLVAHTSAVSSFEHAMPSLERLLGVKIVLCKNLDAVASFWQGNESIALLDNVRSFSGEEENDASFASQLAAGCDAYINNCFSTSHRAHASIVGVPTLLPAVAGPVVVEEVNQLSSIVTAPRDGKIIFMGGAKAATKIPVIHHLIDKAEYVAVGGVVANGLLKERGFDIGSSRVDEHIHDLIDGLNPYDPRLIFPSDFRKEDDAFMDIGEESIRRFSELVHGAKLIVWNGPFGKFEDARFASGTEAIARALIASGAQTIIGGGDTIAALNQLGLLGSFSFVSTGGGAMLSFLAGEKLPGLEALGYYTQ
jgi:phosphoglycerate kinase